MAHWVVIAGSVVAALGVLYAAARRTLRRIVRAVRNGLAVWRLPECVDQLTESVGALTAELGQLRAAVTDRLKVTDRPNLAEWFEWPDETR